MKRIKIHYSSERAQTGYFFSIESKNRFLKRILFFDNPKNEAANQMLCMLKKEGDIYWVGTDFGIYEFDVKNEKVLKHYLKDEKDVNSLPQNNVFSLVRDSYNQIWVGSYGGGFCKFDPEKGTFKSWNIRNGFPSNCIMAIIEDNNKKLWVTTTNGVVRFDPLTQDYKIYKKEDGFLGNEYNTDSGIKLSTGEIAIGGTSGLNIFNPDELQENKFIPPIRFTKLLVNNEERKIFPSISVNTELHLYPDDKIVEFEFAGLSYIHPENNKYSYWLEGFNDSWINNGNKRSATFTNLDPGKYTFHVKGSNNDGLWNQAGISISLIVHPPYWVTWWFRLIIITLMIGFLYYLYKQRIERFKIVDATRNRIAENLHDDFGGRIGSIGLMASALNTLEEVKTSDEAKTYIKRIVEQSRLVGDDLKDVVWSLHEGDEDWKDLLSRYRRFAADLLGNANIEFEINIDEVYPGKMFDPEKRINYLMTLKEITNNVVKHSKCKRAFSEIKFEGNNIITNLTDDGVGFDSSKDYNGLGLKSITKRLKLLGADYKLLSSPGNGTQWFIKIKL